MEKKPERLPLLQSYHVTQQLDESHRTAFFHRDALMKAITFFFLITIPNTHNTTLIKFVDWLLSENW